MKTVLLSQYVSDAMDTCDVFNNELIRRQNNSSIDVNYVWTTKIGMQLPISEMSTQHIINTIELIRAAYQEYLIDLTAHEECWG